MEEVLIGLNGVVNLSDDIIMWGESEKQHDENVHAVMDRLDSYGITLRPRKCKFKVTELNFFGLVFTSEGVKIAERKLDALTKATPPKSPSEAISFLGLASYCDRFIPNFATLADPIRQVSKANSLGQLWELP